jgi:hypothetical protein
MLGSQIWMSSVVDRTCGERARAGVGAGGVLSSLGNQNLVGAPVRPLLFNPASFQQDVCLDVEWKKTR